MLYRDIIPADFAVVLKIVPIFSTAYLFIRSTLVIYKLHSGMRIYETKTKAAAQDG